MEQKKPFSYDLVKEGEENILRIDCEAFSSLPSIEDNAIVMSKTIEILIEAGQVSKIIFMQKRDYEYDFYQTQLLIEIAALYNKLAKQKELFSYYAIGPECIQWFRGRYARIRLLIFRMMKEDPLGAYVELKRELRKERLELDKMVDKRYISCEQKYMSLLDYLVKDLGKTKLITIAAPYLAGYKLGDRKSVV